MYGETYHGRHSAQHQLQWWQINIKTCVPLRAMKTFIRKKKYISRTILRLSESTSHSVVPLFRNKNAFDLVWLNESDCLLQCIICFVQCIISTEEFAFFSVYITTHTHLHYNTYTSRQTLNHICRKKKKKTLQISRCTLFFFFFLIYSKITTLRAASEILFENQWLNKVLIDDFSLIIAF